MPSLETVNVGKTIAKRVGENIQEVRTNLGMTQAQLAGPEFSISYISSIECGEIGHSLKALSILARRLNVPLTFLVEGSPSEVAQALAIGYSPAEWPFLLGTIGRSYPVIRIGDCARWSSQRRR